MQADTDALREEIAASLHALSTAACIQLIRFRKHTARSAAGHTLDVVVDELAGGDADFVDNRSHSACCNVIALTEVVRTAAKHQQNDPPQVRISDTSVSARDSANP